MKIVEWLEGLNEAIKETLGKIPDAISFLFELAGKWAGLLFLLAMVFLLVEIVLSRFH